MTAKTNREIERFINEVGGNKEASKILGVSVDMVRKMKVGLRGFNPDIVRAMYNHKGYRLSFMRLFDLDYRRK